jgi:hypothetical protein
LVLALGGCGSPSRQLPPGAGVRDDTPDVFVMPTALVMEGLRREARGDSEAALDRYRRALALARRRPWITPVDKAGPGRVSV